MNKKKITTIIVLLVVIIIILGVVGFSHKAKAPAVSSGTTSTSSTLPITVTASSTSNSPQATITLSTSTKRTYGNASFLISYPPSWSIAQYSPFLMTNFGGKYLSGDILPKGGAEITIVTTTVETGYLPGIMQTQLMNAMDLATTTLTVDGVACPAAAYESAYAPGYASKDVSVYCLRGNELWEIYLSYDASDTAMSTPVADFNSVLGSMKFL
jgi:hypothetical protein